MRTPVKKQPREYLLTAQLTSAYGVRGGLHFYLLGHDPEFFPKKGEGYLLNAKEELLRPVSYHWEGEGKTARIFLSGVSSREEAERLRFHYLARTREQVPALEEGEYFVCDLLGLEVYDVDQQVSLGHLKEILQATAQDVYVVEREGKKDLLFPLAPGTLEEVDFEAGRLAVHLPRGLLEIYE